MSHRGRGSEKCQKSVTNYSNGPLYSVKILFQAVTSFMDDLSNEIDTLTLSLKVKATVSCVFDAIMLFDKQ